MGSEAKTPTGGELTGRRHLGNYRKGPWDEVSEAALDTAANHSIAHSNLRLFDGVDANIDFWQGMVDRRLELIAANLDSPMVRHWTTEAQQARQQVELWKAINEDNVHDGHDAVKRARVHNGQVIGIAETERRAAARAQVPRNRRAR